MNLSNTGCNYLFFFCPKTESHCLCPFLKCVYVKIHMYLWTVLLNSSKNMVFQLPSLIAEMTIVFNSRTSKHLFLLQCFTAKGDYGPSLEEFLICGSATSSFWGKLLKSLGPYFTLSECIPTVNTFKHFAASLQFAAFAQCKKSCSKSSCVFSHKLTLPKEQYM